MKVIILDDLPERHEGFLRIFGGKDHQLTHAWTYGQAVKAMKAEKFDLACLDHDLGDFAGLDHQVRVESENFELTYSPDFVSDTMYGSSVRYLTGLDVVQWMVENEFRCPPRVLIHSWNPEGAARMASALRSISWIEVLVKPFEAPRR